MQGVGFYRARYYDSSTGRFISEDPIGFGSYAYVDNSPMGFIDPSGMSKKPCEHPCTAQVPDGLLLVVDTVVGEQSTNNVIGRHSYQYGDKLGTPTGPVIAAADLDRESYLIASSMVTRGNSLYGNKKKGTLHNLTLDEVISAPQQYIAYSGRHGRVDRASHSEEGSNLCIALHRALARIIHEFEDKRSLLCYKHVD